MALGTRELYLILRARDEASTVLRGFGGSLSSVDKATQEMAQKQALLGRTLTTVGIGVGLVGAAGLKFFDASIKSAIEYNRVSGLTLTQVDQLGVHLEDIKNIGRTVASEVPVPFEQTQSALYDIFSSMDVNVKQAQTLLEAFSKAGVAGQVDLSEASRATIAIMNAYRLKVSDVNHVNDVMFQLVRKGVGTYSEFATTIGQAIPAAVRSGQSIETLAGMLAFLTRNGLSASRASTSAARALENLANPKVDARLQAMGISVKTATGEFRPMQDVVTQLGKKLANLTAPERAAALQKILAGAGNSIQARRFWDLAIKNYDELNQRVGEMQHSAGTLDTAYNQMFVQPQSQIQLMKNNLDILKTEVGDALLPSFLKLVKGITSLVKWFNNLSPHTKSMIVRFTAIASGALLLIGGITALVGMLLMLNASLIMLGTSLLAVVGWAALAVAAIAAIVAIVIVVIKYHKQIAHAIETAWNAVKDAIMTAVNAVVGFVTDHWQLLLAIILAPFAPILAAIVLFHDQIFGAFQAAWNAIVGFLTTTWNAILGAFQTAWAAIVGAVTAGVNAVLGVITSVFNSVKDFIVKLWQSDIAQFFRDVFFIILNIIRIALETILLAVVKSFQGIWDAIQLVWNGIKAATQTVWNFIKDNILLPIWNTIKAVATTSFNAVKDVITKIWDALKAATQAVWDFIKDNVLVPIWNAISTAASATWNAISSAVQGVWNAMKAAASAIFGALKAAIDAVWGAIQSVASSVWGAISGVLNAAWNNLKSNAESTFGALKSAIVDPLSEAYNGVVNMVDNIIGYLRHLWDEAKSLASSIRDTLEKINPLKHLSPSVVEKVDKGMDALTKVTVRPLQNMARVTDPLAQQIRDNMTFTGGSDSNYGTSAVGRGPLPMTAGGLGGTKVVSLSIGTLHVGSADEAGAKEFVEQVRTALAGI